MNHVEDFANKICESQPQGKEKIVPAVLIPILIGLLQSCTKEAARKVMLIAGKRPNGMVARTVRKQIQGKLPQSLNIPTIVDQIMLTVSKAAEDKELWNSIYEFHTTSIAEQEFDDFI